MDYAHFPKSIGDYTQEIRRINISKGFRPADGGPGDNTFGDYIALAHSELSEALEAYRDHRLDDATVEPDFARTDGVIMRDETGRPVKAMPKPEGVGSELADVFIRLLDMCDVFGINLTAEVERKIAYNRTRAFQHGGRTLADTPVVGGA